MHERLDGVDVVRTYVYATRNKGVLRRGLSYASFAASSVLLGAAARHVRGADVLIASSPQFLCAVSGWMLARALRLPFVLEIRDLWPQSIVEVGALPASHPVVISLRALERRLYAAADLLVGVTESFARTWREQGVDPRKIRVITNGVDLRAMRPLPAPAALRDELGLRDAFVVGYVGTHGMAHRLEVLLEAAARLRHLPDVRVLLVGEGAERERLRQLAAERGLDNVVFAGPYPRERMPEIYALCDVAAVVLRRTPLFQQVIPSKIFELMACERPILLAVEGEAAAIVRAADAGWVVTPEDVDAITAAIVAARADPDECRRRGRSGAAHARAHYDRDVQARAYVRELESLVSAGAGSDAGD
jgi:glycosyltransferase involved in cell wall biosynthesis